MKHTYRYHYGYNSWVNVINFTEEQEIAIDNAMASYTLSASNNCPIIPEAGRLMRYYLQGSKK
jgi:hypothetical protein